MLTKKLHDAISDYGQGRADLEAAIAEHGGSSPAASDAAVRMHTARVILETAIDYAISTSVGPFPAPKPAGRGAFRRWVDFPQIDRRAGILPDLSPSQDARSQARAWLIAQLAAGFVGTTNAPCSELVEQAAAIVAAAEEFCGVKT